MFGRSTQGVWNLQPSCLKTNMRPWKSTIFETEIYGHSSWKTSMLGQKMRKRRKTCLQKLPFVNFIRRRMAKDWYLGVCPMRVRRDSPIETRQISLKPGSDGKKHERGMTLSILELCTWLFFYKMFIPNLWNMSYLPGYLHDMLICIHICPQFHTYTYIIYIYIEYFMQMHIYIV